MPVEIFRLSFRVFTCACPTVTSSIFGKNFHFPFPYFVLFVVWYFPFHMVCLIQFFVGLHLSTLPISALTFYTLVICNTCPNYFNCFIFNLPSLWNCLNSSSIFPFLNHLQFFHFSTYLTLSFHHFISITITSLNSFLQADFLSLCILGMILLLFCTLESLGLKKSSSY